MQGVQIESNHYLLSGHNSLLPSNADGFDSNKGNFALTNFPFFKREQYTWAVKASGARPNLCWEVSDYSGNSNYNTYHQVWVRYKKVEHMFNLFLCYILNVMIFLLL